MRKDDEDEEYDGEQPDVLVLQQLEAIDERSLDAIVGLPGVGHLAQQHEQHKSNSRKDDDEREDAAPTCGSGDARADDRVERD